MSEIDTTTIDVLLAREEGTIAELRTLREKTASSAIKNELDGALSRHSDARMKLKSQRAAKVAASKPLDAPISLAASRGF